MAHAVYVCTVPYNIFSRQITQLIVYYYTYLNLIIIPFKMRNDQNNLVEIIIFRS